MFCILKVYDTNNPEKVHVGATAENLFNSVLLSFKENTIQMENIIGFGSDGCAAMMGKYNSVSSWMKQIMMNFH